jgi:hypothetical protein
MEIVTEIISDLIARGHQNDLLYYSWSKKCYINVASLFYGLMNEAKKEYPVNVSTHEAKGTKDLFLLRTTLQRITAIFQKTNDMCIELTEEQNVLMGSDNTRGLVFSWQNDCHELFSKQIEEFIMNSNEDCKPQMQLQFSYYVENAFQRGKRQRKPGNAFDAHKNHVIECIEAWYQASNNQEPEMATGE